MKEINIGNKGVMVYLLEILECNEKEVVVKARARYIIKAVDVVMICKRFFGRIIDVKTEIGAEKTKDKYGNKIYLSTITIKVIKNDRKESMVESV